MAKAPTSAAPLNAPRPAARPTNIRCCFTIGQQLDRTFQLGVSRGQRASWVDTGGAIKERKTAFPLRTKNRLQIKITTDRKSAIQVRIHLPSGRSRVRTQSRSIAL